MSHFQFASAKHQLSGASQSESGLMSAADKEKLDGIAAGAQVNPSNSDIVNLIYPVGSIYMSVANASPATLFGGTWAQLKDRFLLGAGDTYTAGDTGGAASVSYTPAGTNSGGAVSSHTLTTDEIPSHNHTFTGSAVTSGGQSQGHTHTFTTGNQSQDHTHTTTTENPNKDHTHTGPSHTHTGPSHTHTGPSHTHSGPSHNHSISIAYKLGDTPLYTGEGICGAAGSAASTYNAIPNATSGLAGTGNTGSGGTGNTGASGTGNTGSSGTGATGGVSQWHTHTGTSGGVSKNHTHSGTSDGISQGHTHSVTASGTIGSKGGGGGHTHGFTQPTFSGTTATIATMPPYLVVYMWKRTA